MKKLIVYYAHPIPTYGSSIEKEDIEMLEKLGFEVLNPSDESIQFAMNQYVFKHGRENIMEYFKSIVKDCDALAFRCLPDGTILSGVAAEIDQALICNLPVFEMPRQISKRCVDVNQTKSILKELGYYK